MRQLKFPMKVLCEGRCGKSRIVRANSQLITKDWIFYIDMPKKHIISLHLYCRKCARFKVALGEL